MKNPLSRRVFFTLLASLASSPAIAQKPSVDLKGLKNPELVKALLDKNFQKLPSPDILFAYLRGLMESFQQTPPVRDPVGACIPFNNPGLNSLTLQRQLGNTSRPLLEEPMDKMIRDLLDMVRVAVSQGARATYLQGQSYQNGKLDGDLLTARCGCDSFIFSQIFESAECLIKNADRPDACVPKPVFPVP